MNGEPGSLLPPLDTSGWHDAPGQSHLVRQAQAGDRSVVANSHTAPKIGSRATLICKILRLSL
jgi:hypothetical protein